MVAALSCLTGAQNILPFSSPFGFAESASTKASTAFEPRLWVNALGGLPLFSAFGFGALDLQVPAIPLPPVSPLTSAPPLPPCRLKPLPEITDKEALEFEANVGSPDVVDLGGLTPATARALQRFQNAVGSVGGSVELKSAYRPPAYQRHLQQVWDKYMQLRGNTETACQALKAQVTDEFIRHDLLVTQRPASVSDHTLGIGFDAAVTVPPSARIKRRRVTLDALARKAGIKRPAVGSDPVHFRLIGGRRLS